MFSVYRKYHVLISVYETNVHPVPISFGYLNFGLTSHWPGGWMKMIVIFLVKWCVKTKF